MHDLKFTPKGENEETFKPKYDNWGRRNKVPTLVLNATTLNTGNVTDERTVDRPGRI